MPALIGALSIFFDLSYYLCLKAIRMGLPASPKVFSSLLVFSGSNLTDTTRDVLPITYAPPSV